MKTQQQIIDSLPVHLRTFAAIQDYQKYTPRDHAVWRFLLRQLRENLTATAHAVYLEGLKRTGISLDEIPRIEVMNQCLEAIGWRAVVVDGFVPPAIFMEFQAHRVLVVAVDMRTVEHMLYTPAPDIVHESAGHAPFIVDVDYSEFLQRFGELGMCAITSRGDMDVYEAIRHLSIVKECSSSTTEEITAAERQLKKAGAANNTPSEAALLSRLHWWTVEYGLVGNLDDYRIFGAGLLSSLGESVSCLDDKLVKKLPLTVNAINTEYDITETQPQLFVAKNCRHLTQVLEEFGRQMCVNRGGASAIEQAIEAGTVNTAVTNSGLEISGRLCRLIKDAVGNVTYFKTEGPTQLAHKRKQLRGHGIDYHAAGFGSPIGNLQGFNRCLSDYTIDELSEKGIAIDRSAVLEFLSGVTVQGILRKVVREQHKNVLFTFDQCTVTGPDGEVLFDPEWGVFDMATGDRIRSVYGGAADQAAYPLYTKSSKQTTVQASYTEDEKILFEAYQRIRTVRGSVEAGENNAAVVESLISELINLADQEWLLCFELLELGQRVGMRGSLVNHLVESLKRLRIHGDEQKQALIEYATHQLDIS